MQTQETQSTAHLILGVMAVKHEGLLCIILNNFNNEVWSRCDIGLKERST